MRRWGIAVALLVGAAACGRASSAETVVVKYRGPVNLAPFACQDISRSSLVQRVCYDKRESYLVINLRGTYYHYCEIPAAVVQSLLTAPSMGQQYNAAIKGHYDCRINRMPEYPS